MTLVHPGTVSQKTGLNTLVVSHKGLSPKCVKNKIDITPEYTIFSKHCISVTWDLLNTLVNPNWDLH